VVVARWRCCGRAQGGAVLEKAEYLGTSHLIATRALKWYNNFVFRLMTRRMPKGGRFAELGPGIGDFTERFRQHGMEIDAVELEPEFHERLKTFSRNVVGNLSELEGQYDAFFAINVLEHIEDDGATLKELFDKTKPGGWISLYHPAHMFLFSHLDVLVHHYRRYSKEELIGKVRAAGFEVAEVRMVDSIGLICCLFYKWLHVGDGNLHPTPMWIYDTFVWPVSRIIDILSFGTIGKSIFVLGRKP
jgi:SAM-dependent methyltransferase